LNRDSNAGNSDPLSIAVPDGFMWHGRLRHLLLLAVLLPGVE
jgi:hypothetical protein